MRKFEKQVKAGIALLDEHGPEDWRERVNLETLSFPSLRLCPLGQVYRDFTLGVAALKLDKDAQWASGFVARNDKYPYLTREWKRQLKGTS